MIKHMHIELDSDKLYNRKFKNSLDGSKTMMKLCCNCYLSECYELGCIEQTSDGICECGLEHGDH